MEQLTALTAVLLFLIQVSCSGPSAIRSETASPADLASVEILKIRWKADKLPQEAGKIVPAVYTVRRGDSLFSIGKRYGISVETIKRLNRLSSNRITPGMKLRLRY